MRPDMRVLIVDDEAHARDRMRRMLEEITQWQALQEASSAEQALALCQQQMPDVVLMDVRMPGISGVEAARHLSGLDNPPAVIFISAYDQYAMEAFDAQAVGYLVKPVRRERLARAIEHAARPTRAQLVALQDAPPDRTPAKRQHIGARVAERLKLIPLREIYYFQADQKYTNMHCAQGELLIDEPLKDLENEFQDEFLRIHRNALVALRHLESIERDAQGRYWVKVANGASLAVSRRHASALRKRLRRS